MEAKKRIAILVIICLVILIVGLVVNFILNNKKDYLVLLSYDQVIEKLENKETFVLLVSQTTCSHCAEFKPKLRRIANNYELTIYYMENNLLTKKQDDEIKKHFSIDGTPTVIFIQDGEEKAATNRINGNVKEDKIISKLKSNGFIE